MSSVIITVTGQSSGWGDLAALSSPEAQNIARHLALTPARLGTIAREEEADAQHEALVHQLMETLKANEAAVLESEKQLSDLRGKCKQVQLTRQTSLEGALQRLDELEEMLKQQNAEVRTQEASGAKFAMDIKTVEGRLATLRPSLNQKSSDLQAALVRKTALEGSLRNSRAALASNESQYNSNSSQASSLRSRIADLERRVSSLRSSIPNNHSDASSRFTMIELVGIAATVTGPEPKLEKAF